MAAKKSFGYALHYSLYTSNDFVILHITICHLLSLRTRTLAQRNYSLSFVKGSYYARSILSNENMSVNTAKAKEFYKIKNGRVDPAEIVELEVEREVSIEPITMNEITEPNLEGDDEQLLGTTCSHVSPEQDLVERNETDSRAIQQQCRSSSTTTISLATTSPFPKQFSRASNERRNSSPQGAYKRDSEAQMNGNGSSERPDTDPAHYTAGDHVEIMTKVHKRASEYSAQENDAGLKRILMLGIDLTLGYSFLLRGDIKRSLKLSTLNLLDKSVPGVGTIESMGIYIMEQESQPRGPKRIVYAARHVNVFTCPLGMMADWIVFTFHDMSELDLCEQENWESFRILFGSDPELTISYSAQVDHYKELDELRRFKDKTELGRKALAIVADESGVREDHIRLQEYGDQDAMSAYFSPGVARDFVMAEARDYNMELQYTVERNRVEPPEELYYLLFPFLEESEEILKEWREDDYEPHGAAYIIQFFRRIAKIFLQDMVCKELSFKTWFIESNHPLLETEVYKRFRCELRQELGAANLREE